MACLDLRLLALLTPDQVVAGRSLWLHNAPPAVCVHHASWDTLLLVSVP